MNPPHGLSIVALAGSAGAIEPLRRIVAGLPRDFGAAVLVATHVPPESVSALPHILGRSGALFATHAIDGAPLAKGMIVLAPPNTHLTVADGVMRVQQGPRENGHRPSIDVLFRSLAQHGGRIAAVLLSGALDDGVAGLREIRNSGGLTIAQDPSEAVFPDMPRNAVERGAAELHLPAAEIAATLVEFSNRDGIEDAAGLVAVDERRDGESSVFTCPDCGGTLWEWDGDDLRFRCRTGHAFSEVSMLASHEGMLESAYWRAIRVLEERCDLLRKIAHRAGERGDRHTAARLKKQLGEASEHIAVIRGALGQMLENASRAL